MRKLLALLILFIPFYSMNAMVRTGVEVEEEEPVDDDNVYYVEDVWIGPGWYYGIWFDDEDEFYRWRGHHHGDFHGDHGGHHGGGHGGGGHHGGGHGGGHR